jgi:hypothetical protein
MASLSRRAAVVARARLVRVAACSLALAFLAPPLAAQDALPTIGDPATSTLTAPVAPDESRDSPSDPAAEEIAPLLDPAAAELDQWEPLVEPAAPLGDCAPLDEKPDLRPFDWMRHWGFHHSSTEGRFMDKGLAMERASWLNRPYHVDWFLGPLLADGPVDGRVTQSNEMFGGLRIGWDFDYYWGVEWRFGWADPQLLADTAQEELSGKYFVSDVDFIYYPWGDTKVRPYAQWGLGVTEVGSVRVDGSGQVATLLSMPMGIGVRFPQTHWLVWRLEIIDNLAFGADGVDTMNNFAFTAGMEVRLGARPNSYWPWRSSRTIW